MNSKKIGPIAVLPKSAAAPWSRRPRPRPRHRSGCRPPANGRPARHGREGAGRPASNRSVRRRHEAEPLPEASRSSHRCVGAEATCWMPSPLYMLRGTPGSGLLAGVLVDGDEDLAVRACHGARMKAGSWPGYRRNGSGGSEEVLVAVGPPVQPATIHLWVRWWMYIQSPAPGGLGSLSPGHRKSTS